VNTVNSASKLALGTVQFGLAYGVANRQGQVSVEEVGFILDEARHAGVVTLDTAIAYGESESVLGQHDLKDFTIVTKLPEMPANCNDVAGWVETELTGSLARLGVASVDSLLLHRPMQLLEANGENLFKALISLREYGSVRRIGVSVYSPEELTELASRYDFDLVQAPFNVLDKRLDESGWLDRMVTNGTDLHVRSVFMQGLLLMSEFERPEKFAPWAEQWSLWQEWLDQAQLTPLQACLRHALRMQQIERVVVGVDSLSQWREILQAAAGDCPSIPEDLGCTDVKLLNPALWSAL
tara:strand:- start:36496 stop:37383 length:888 start_codon:yes stop_codon:yes gene_type:complete